MTRRKFQGAKRVDKQSTWHDERFEDLTAKLYRWLILQPEWVAILSADRQTRKRYERLVAQAVCTIPPYVTEPPPAMKRLAIRVGPGGSESRPERKPAPVASAPGSAPTEGSDVP